MRLFHLLVISIFCVPNLLFGQKTVYFNDNWLASEKSEASYYSVIYPIKGAKFLVKDYAISEQLISETDYTPKVSEIEWERLYEEGFQKFAIEDGDCIRYYPNGKRKIQFTFKEGKQEGLVREWSENGKLLREFFANNHIANGVYHEYFEDGAKHFMVNFENDTLNGAAIYYHSNGSIAQKGMFTSGMKMGNWDYWSDKGKKIATETYRNSFFIEGPDIRINFPKGYWCLADQFKEEELMNFVFSRSGTDNGITTGFTPTCILSLEYVGEDADLVDYSSFRRRRLSVDIHKIISKEQELFSLSNSMGYFGSFTDKNDKTHNTIILHSIQKGIGVEMILDIRKEDYEKLKKEVVYILRSINK